MRVLENWKGTRYSGAMAEPSDLESLARRFLDLWQEQLSAMAVDPEFSASAERILTTFSSGTMEGSAGDETATSGSAARATAAGDASGAGDHDLRRLEHRLAALEKRLEALESGTAGDGGSTRGGG